jgi:hypothetical protein
MSEPVDTQYIGTVEKVVVDGRYGSYAVIRVEKLGAITFSLKPPVWNESDHPEQGMFVVLSEVRRKRAGWRAMKGRFMKPSDQKSAT